MKFVTIADTHGKHNELILPPGDCLIHAGDISVRGEEFEIVDFLNWFIQQDFKNKILIAGNHDFFFEREAESYINQLVPKNIFYLKDDFLILNALKIWGSPVTPWFYNWAFNRRRGEQIKRHWDLIPLDTDILITHGPAYRRLDCNTEGQHVGCKDLFNRIDEVKPKVHVCGHIHEAYGTVTKSETRFINASVLNEKYQLVNEPIVFEL